MTDAALSQAGAQPALKRSAIEARLKARRARELRFRWYGRLAITTALVFLAVLRIVQDYIVYPRLIGQGIHLHPLAVIIAILSGAELAGVAGIFLAIPVVAIVTVLYRHWLEHRGSEGLADLLEPTPSEPEIPEEIAELVDE